MMNSLTKADWPHKDGPQKLITALGADNIRWVGGAVRDTLLGLEVHDVDCATLHHPDETMRMCKEAGIRTVPTGIDHGTVTAIFDDGPIEVTTLRRDVATDGRRATVAFADNWRDDAARRDFTINALYAHPETLEISDYFGGLADLEARIIRFIGEARERIAEDHLRILRYYRFQARFGSHLDEKAEAACSDMAQTLKGLSRERVSGELLNLLGLPNPIATVARMHESNVLQVILPESGSVHLRCLSSLIDRERDQKIAPAPVRRLAALLPPSPEVAMAVAARLRLSKAQRARLVTAASRLPSDGDDLFTLAYYEGRGSAIDRLLLEGGDARVLIGWEAPRFPLKGGSIVARGIATGPNVARLMQETERQWVKEGFPDEARIEQILQSKIT